MSPFDSEPETHPSFGLARVNRVHGTGTHLFDSEVKHSEYVILEIKRAERRREINRDWINETREPDIINISMSMAQWGALVSSFGSGGVPVTIERVNGERMEEVPHEQRLSLSVKEVEGATDKLLDGVKRATETLRDLFDKKAGRKETAEALRNLELRLSNAKSNARYTANTFTEHVENVITKARFDIEAVVSKAAERGLAAGDALAELLPVQSES